MALSGKDGLSPRDCCSSALDVGGSSTASGSRLKNLLVRHWEAREVCEQARWERCGIGLSAQELKDRNVGDKGNSR